MTFPSILKRHALQIILLSGNVGYCRLGSYSDYLATFLWTSYAAGEVVWIRPGRQAFFYGEIRGALQGLGAVITHFSVEVSQGLSNWTVLSFTG